MPPHDLHIAYELEINVLFGFIKMADEMGFKPQWWFDRKKAQQENGIWIKSKSCKIKKNEPKRKVEKKFYVEEKSKLLSKSLLWDSEACDLAEFLATTIHLYVLRVQMCNVYWKK